MKIDFDNIEEWTLCLTSLALFLISLCALILMIYKIISQFQ